MHAVTVYIEQEHLASEISGGIQEAMQGFVHAACIGLPRMKLLT